MMRSGQSKWVGGDNAIAPHAIAASCAAQRDLAAPYLSDNCSLAGLADEITPFLPRQTRQYCKPGVTAFVPNEQS